MKLDKIRFARLIAWLSVKVKFQLEINDINELDELINIEPDARPIGVDPDQLHYLMSLMQEGTKKIEAIKVHRTLTGYGLKESKDAVEKYWNTKPSNQLAMIKKIDQQLDYIPTETNRPYTLEGFTPNQLDKVKEFINSF